MTAGIRDDGKGRAAIGFANVARIRELLGSEEFGRDEPQAREVSADGTATLVEVNMSGSHLYRAFSVYDREGFGYTLMQTLKGSSNQ